MPDLPGIRGDVPDAYRKSFLLGLKLAGNKFSGSTICLVEEKTLAPDSYRITRSNGVATFAAGSSSGFQYAGSGASAVPENDRIEKPAFARRGVMLDISRNKVPTMDTLRDLVDRLAFWKINHLQLYTEHTFAYRDHEQIWRGCSPMTAAEVRELDHYCRERHIELSANQNSLGHLHRWLKHPSYAHLAEAPQGYTTPWGEKRNGPFSLNPIDPRSLELLAGWYQELLPNFESKWVNVGCDEAFDLGQGASRAACDTLGKGRVYLDYVLQVKKLIEHHGKRMMFWGDIILNHPGMIPHLEKDLLALVWGYEADHPFEEQCRSFAEAAVPFWVCPGTSMWNSITGRLDNALANIQSAAHAGLKHGAGGILITEWGDNGHWQTMPFTLMALAAGAKTAWTGTCPSAAELSADFADGTIIAGLGRIYLDAGFPLHNTSPAFPLLRFQDPVQVLPKWTTERLLAALGHAAALKNGLKPGGEQNRWHKEIDLGARMVSHALQRGLWLKENKPAKLATTLGDDLELIIGDFRKLWLERNRPGGLDESMEPLLARLAEYRNN